MPSQYFKRFSRISFIVFILRTVLISRTCHLPCYLIFDNHHQLRVDFSYPKKKLFLFWSLFQQSTSMASHDELNLIKTIGSSMNCIMFHFRHVPNSDTLSNYYGHSHMGSVLFLYILWLHCKHTRNFTKSRHRINSNIDESKFAMGGNFVKNDMLVIFLISPFIFDIRMNHELKLSHVNLIKVDEWMEISASRP